MTSARKMAAITKTATDPGSSQTLLEPLADCGRRGLGQRTGLHARQSIHDRGGLPVRHEAYLGCLAMDDLDRAVHAVVHECLGVKEGEEALVICNPATQRVGERLREEAAEAGADAVLTVISERPSHGAEPPRVVAEAMAAADVLMAPTVQSLSHTAARKRATDAGARCATLPGVTEEMLARVMSADMEGLRRKGHAVAEALDRASEARITDANGTDLRLDLSGRRRSPTPASSPSPGPSATCPAARGSSRPRAARAHWSSTARSRGSAWSTNPSSWWSRGAT